jgi:hypothetical protein
MAGKMVPAVFGNVPNLEIVPILFEDHRQLRCTSPTRIVESNPGHAEWRRLSAQTRGAHFGACFDGDAWTAGMFVARKAGLVGST